MSNSNLRSPSSRGGGEQGLGPRYVGGFGARVLQLLGWLLKTGNPAATMDRLFESQHVGDLRLVVATALMILCIGVVTYLGYVFTYALGDALTERWSFIAVFKAIMACIGILTTTFGLVGAICAWAYKVGSARLGVVDLFACEISTVCRVVTVTDMVGRLIDRIERMKQANSAAEPTPEAERPVSKAGHDRASPPLPMQFRSAENYFPVFEHNTRDLQSLEARVVVNITSFYTYMKTVRDLLRTATARTSESARGWNSEPTTPGASKDDLHADTWHNAMRDVIYMLFLGLEAGRSSVRNLVEFEPERAEQTIVILLSELKSYLFLLKEFANSDDIRERRLRLRWKKYQEIVPSLCSRIREGVESSGAADVMPTADSSSRNEFSVEAFSLGLWQGAMELVRDLELLYRDLEVAMTRGRP